MTNNREAIAIEVSAPEARVDVETQLLHRTIAALQQEVQALQEECMSLTRDNERLTEEVQDLQGTVDTVRTVLERERKLRLQVDEGYRQVIVQQAIAAWYPDQS